MTCCHTLEVEKVDPLEPLDSSGMWNAAWVHWPCLRIHEQADSRARLARLTSLRALEGCRSAFLLWKRGNRDLLPATEPLVNKHVPEIYFVTWSVRFLISSRVAHRAAPPRTSQLARPARPSRPRLLVLSPLGASLVPHQSLHKKVLGWTSGENFVIVPTVGVSSRQRSFRRIFCVLHFRLQCMNVCRINIQI